MTSAASNGTEEVSLLTMRLLEASKIFNHFYIPVLCLFGALGNCLSVSVFCKPSPHRSLSASLYLSAVAISDTGFLISLIAVWLEGIGVPVITTSFTCPLFMYLGQVTCFLSVWFIVAFTIERFFAVCYPLTRPKICTVARAKKVIAILTIAALVGFSYVWVIATVVEYPVRQHFTTHSPCDPRNATENECNIPLEEPFIAGSIFPQFNNKTEDSNIKTTNPELSPHTASSSFPTKSFCSVRQEHLYFSGIASHIDSVLTLILPFGIISYLNLRIAACVWRFRVQRENLMATAMGKQGERSNSEPAHSHSRGPVSFVYRSKHCAGNENNLNKFSTHNQLVSANAQPFREKVNLGDLEPTHSRSTSNNSPSNALFSLEAPSRRLPIDAPASRRPVRKGRAQGYARVEARVTKTLLLVSTVFLVLNLPSHAIRAATFLQFFWKIDIRPESLFAAQQWANVLFNMNFSVNFLLYCVSGKNFRASVRRIVLRKSRLRRHPKSKLVGSLLLIGSH